MRCAHPPHGSAPLAACTRLVNVAVMATPVSLALLTWRK